MLSEKGRCCRSLASEVVRVVDLRRSATGGGRRSDRCSRWLEEGGDGRGDLKAKAGV